MTFLRAMTTSFLGLELVSGLAACAVPTEDPSANPKETSESTASAASAATIGDELLVGPWQFLSSDLIPNSGDIASTYSINGDSIDLKVNGVMYHWNGTTYRGYTFDQPAALEEGATYDLALVISNNNSGAPVFLNGTLSGAGATQSQMFYGNGTLHMTFTVSSCPGASPTVTLGAHPITATFGPIQGAGMGLFNYTVTASLIRTQ